MEEYFDLKSRGVFVAAAPGESSRRIKEKEESGQRTDREDADRRPQMQSTDSGGDEQNERMQAMANLSQSTFMSITDGTVDCSDSRLPSDGYVMNMYVISALLDHHWTHINALVMRESQG